MQKNKWFVAVIVVSALALIIICGIVYSFSSYRPECWCSSLFDFKREVIKDEAGKMVFTVSEIKTSRPDLFVVELGEQDNVPEDCLRVTSKVRPEGFLMEKACILPFLSSPDRDGYEFQGIIYPIFQFGDEEGDYVLTIDDYPNLVSYLKDNGIKPIDAAKLFEIIPRDGSLTVAGPDLDKLKRPKDGFLIFSSATLFIDEGPGIINTALNTHKVFGISYKGPEAYECEGDNVGQMLCIGFTTSKFFRKVHDLAADLDYLLRCQYENIGEPEEADYSELYDKLRLDILNIAVPDRIQESHNHAD